MDFARRPLSSNVFSVKSKEGEIGDSSVARDKPVMVELCLKVMSDKKHNFQEFRCSLCCKLFESKNAARNHKRRFHKVKVLSSEVLINEVTDYLYSHEPTNHQGTGCGQ